MSVLVAWVWPGVTIMSCYRHIVISFRPPQTGESFGNLLPDNISGGLGPLSFCHKPSGPTPGEIGKTVKKSSQTKEKEHCFVLFACSRLVFLLTGGGGKVRSFLGRVHRVPVSSSDQMRNHTDRPSSLSQVSDVPLETLQHDI